MTTTTAHFTNFGVSRQPRCADQEGFVEFRENFEALPGDEWTEAEAWISRQQERIDEFRRA